MPIKRLKTINLADISRKLDLVNQNDYIAQRINKKKSRSNNSTPFKRPY